MENAKLFFEEFIGEKSQDFYSLPQSGSARKNFVGSTPNQQYIITENGIADLYGKTLKDRAMEMIKIAHPNHQEWIDKAYFDLLNTGRRF